ncbi:MAG: S8 family serine peptidase [Bdellovibrionales bacterium]|nr:S8 family serine peptidase [Bdellovibrionales bacterium]
MDAKCNKPLSLKPLMMGVILALGFLFGFNGFADSKKYIVTFKNTQKFMSVKSGVRKSKKLAELGLGQSRESDTRFLNTNAKPLAVLDHLEMIVIESEQDNIIAQLLNHPAVADVEQEVILKSPVPVNGFQRILGDYNQSLKCPNKTPWGISAVKAEEAWTLTQGEQSRVAILDTGIDATHPALASRFEKGRDFSSRFAFGGPHSGDAELNGDYSDKIGHGTHVAGTIAADGTCISGVAPKAKLLMGKVCDEGGCGTAAIISGIDWAIAEHVQVISMSLGGVLTTPSQQRAVLRAEQANVVVVAASGNDGVRRISYPAAYPSVIAVGAVAQENGTFKRANFSQYGQGLDIVAPGVDVVSTVPMGFGRVSSVSMDFGDGKATPVKSTSFSGALQNSTPISGQLVFVGLGKPEDVKAVDLKGKFALVQRGEITFKDKVVNALGAGATGVVIFNHEEGLARGGLGEDGSISIPVAMIEKSVGEQIRTQLSSGGVVTASIVTERSDFDSYDGTSMATPHVAGVVALVRSINPQISAVQVRDILAQTSVNIGNADEYGTGLVDAFAAVQKAKITTPVAPAESVDPIDPADPAESADPIDPADPGVASGF